MFSIINDICSLKVLWKISRILWA